MITKELKELIDQHIEASESAKSYRDLADKILAGKVNDLKIQFHYEEDKPKEKENTLDEDGSLSLGLDIPDSFNAFRWVAYPTNDQENCRIGSAKTGFIKGFNQKTYISIIMGLVSQYEAYIDSLELRIKKQLNK